MIHWMTTNPNPRVVSHTPDAGQRGWRLHAIEASADATGNDVRFAVAVCGIRAAHGWGIDLFIERKCMRCAAKVKE